MVSLRRHSPALAVAACGMVATIATLGLALSATSDRAVAALGRAHCSPLRVVDRFGHLLRELPGDCAPYGRSNWTALAAVPAIVPRMLVASEDRRFELHAGVDVRAVARATATNLRAGRIVSGASTLTMQLARMLEPLQGRAGTGATRSWSRKLSQAWTAVALERRVPKPEILEAYLNLAYFGAGAYGIDAAAQIYFGKSVAALSDAESSLLAVLPRAPGTYDPRRDLAPARRRRERVLAVLVQRGELAGPARNAILEAPLVIAPRRAAPASAAGHFVDYVLRELSGAMRGSGGFGSGKNESQSANEKQNASASKNQRASGNRDSDHQGASWRQRGGVLETTLDLGLQTTLERIVDEHVAGLADRGVDQAGLVVLDTDSGAIRAMVGSRAYTASQVNIATRRRQLGSLLKPFVYALAIERGEDAASIALDVGDVSPNYRARDWVGREAGPMSYKEALAGSYNLAAIHVLERVGVAALHAKLREAGVAELASPPARYGLMLALGSARVRLLDVASGYGFLVRGGLTRPAHAIEALARSDGSTWRPKQPPERTLFSEAVSWQVMDMLSDSPARHRRFGPGLPLEAASPLAAKTGTASGLSDVSAIIATREFIVAAWAGRFDGQPTHGASGMWAAAPLASRALVAALGGKQPTLPPRPNDPTLARGPASMRGGAARARAEAPPPELEQWAERARARAGRTREHEAR